MKKMISFYSKGKALWFALLTGAFLLVGINDSSAQQFASAQGSGNPYASIAGKFNVAAYPLGTFDRGQTIQRLEQMLAAIRPIITLGGGDAILKYKYEYYNRILGDVNTHYIAPEISLLTRLSSLDGTSKVTGLQLWQLAQVYIETVNQLQ